MAMDRKARLIAGLIALNAGMTTEQKRLAQEGVENQQRDRQLGVSEGTLGLEKERTRSDLATESMNRALKLEDRLPPSPEQLQAGKEAGYTRLGEDWKANNYPPAEREGAAPIPRLGRNDQGQEQYFIYDASQGGYVPFGGPKPAKESGRQGRVVTYTDKSGNVYAVPVPENLPPGGMVLGNKGAGAGSNNLPLSAYESLSILQGNVNPAMPVSRLIADLLSGKSSVSPATLKTLWAEASRQTSLPELNAYGQPTGRSVLSPEQYQKIMGGIQEMARAAGISQDLMTPLPSMTPIPTANPSERPMTPIPNALPGSTMTPIPNASSYLPPEPTGSGNKLWSLKGWDPRKEGFPNAFEERDERGLHWYVIQDGMKYELLPE